MDTYKINLLRKVAAIGAVIIFLFLIYLGSYLPFRKASLYIETVRSLNTVRTLEELKGRLDRVFDFNSPVGDEEVLRFMTSELARSIGGNTPQPVAEFLVGYLEQRFLELAASRPDANLNKMIYQLAQLRLNYGFKYQDGYSLALAEQYYREGLRLSPRRPEFLFSLYDLYRSTGKTEAAAAIEKEILSYWPDIKI